MILLLAMRLWDKSKSARCYFATVSDSFWWYQWTRSWFPRSAEVARFAASMHCILISLTLQIVILPLFAGSDTELPVLIFPPVEMLTLFNCYRLLIKEGFGSYFKRIQLHNQVNGVVFFTHLSVSHTMDKACLFGYAHGGCSGWQIFL